MIINNGQKKRRETTETTITNRASKNETNVGLSQYTETNMMQILFNLLRIKGLYMFHALFAHPQEALHKRHLVYCICVMHSTPILVAAN
jgi:hypothetical protein